LLGGETAEHPGHFGPDASDRAGAAPGGVEADAILGPERGQPGDTVLALASSGLHSNGYSLVREILRQAGLDLGQDVPELSRSLGAELLEPSRIYALDCLALAAACDVHAYAHITGGGLAANLTRVMPRGLVAVLDRGTWTPAAEFVLIARRGRVPRTEMERTFNMGVGMVAVVHPDDVDRAMAVLTARHVPAWVLGEVHKACDVGVNADAERAVLHGDHPRF